MHPFARAARSLAASGGEKGSHRPSSSMKGVGGQDACEHSHRASGIASVEKRRWLAKPAQAATVIEGSVPLGFAPSSSMETPRARKQSSVDRQSPPVE